MANNKIISTKQTKEGKKVANFSLEWKEELKSRNDIVSTISHYITLKKKGKNYWGVCPFHYEKTPSFSVDGVQQYYKCFGCGEAGDVIQFVQKYENIGFLEAVEILAKNAGMEMPKIEKSPDYEKKKQEKEKILQALRESARFYHQVLNSPKGKVCRDYLEKRGVSHQSITNFGMGYSPDFNSLITHLQSKGFDLDILKKAGLVDVSEKGHPFDAYAQRLIFPLINTFGDVIGFSGRILVASDFAKYKNTAQTVVFDKSKVVFAINLVSKLRKELHSDVPRIVLVEGQLDVVSMHQAGFNNTVACLGTAITPMHAKELKKLTDNIVILLDGDSAGQKATLRSIDILKPSGLSIKIATLPEGMDPDEFLKSHSKEDMQELLDNATEAMDFQLKTLAKKFDLKSNEQKSRFIKEALALIKTLETDAEKNIYLEFVRKLTNVPVDILRQDLLNIKVVQPEVKDEITAKNIFSEQEQDAFMKADKFLLASLLYRKPWANLGDCLNVSFLNPDATTLFDYVHTPNFVVGGIFDRIDVQASPFLQSVVNCVFNDETGEQVWQDCLAKNKERGLLIEKDVLEKSFSSLTSEERKQVANKLFEIDLKLAKLKNKNN